MTIQTSRFTWRHIVLLLACSFILPPLLSIAFILFVAQPVKNEGRTMEPVIKSGDRIFLKKRVSTIQRGDIVVFHFPLDQSKSFIKRVVGLPDETISIDGNGKTYINGSSIEEPYVLPANHLHPRIMSETKIKPDHYFVMGDNRDASNDSCSWGQVPKDLIYGKYMFTYWSTDEE